MATAIRRHRLAAATRCGTQIDRGRAREDRPAVAADRARPRSAALKMTTRLLLASTSPYRRELLSRLRIPFDIARPEVDETPSPGELPLALAQRLAAAKAATIAMREGNAWVIG